jgi:hypothetical protein
VAGKEKLVSIRRVSCTQVVFCALAVLLSLPAATQERREQLNVLIEKLNSPDPTARIDAFEGAVSGKDTAARQLALRTVLSSGDPVLRSLALKAILQGRKTLDVVLTLPPQVREAEAAAGGDDAKIAIPKYRNTAVAFAEWAASFPFALMVDESGAIRCKLMRTRLGSAEDKEAFEGQISGTNVELTGKATDAGGAILCNVRLQLLQDGTLAGTASCEGHYGGILPFGASAVVL